jgi:hypothetical protein
MAWIKRRRTAQRYDVSVRTIERWEADPKLNFPQSMIRNGRRYDNEENLDAWDTECAAAGRITHYPRNNREVKASSSA